MKKYIIKKRNGEYMQVSPMLEMLTYLESITDNVSPIINKFSNTNKMGLIVDNLLYDFWLDINPYIVDEQLYTLIIKNQLYLILSIDDLKKQLNHLDNFDGLTTRIIDNINNKDLEIHVSDHIVKISKYQTEFITQ